MNIKLFLGGCAIVSLAACNSTSNPEGQKDRFLTANGDAVNVEFTDRNQAESVIGFRATTITAGADSKDATGSGASAQGTSKRVPADCKLVGNGYNAEFKTPALVNMPSFGPNMKPVEVSCTYNDKVFSETFKPTNLSAGARDGAALGVGLVLCPICGVAVAVSNKNDKPGDVYGFDSMNVTIN